MNNKLFSRGMLLAAGIAFVVTAIFGSMVFLPVEEAAGGWIYVKEQPKLVVSPLPIEYKRKVKVTIAGSGFDPEQDIELHIVMGGVPSDISTLVKPDLDVNEFGAFHVEWVLNREIRAKLLEPTAYTLEAVDGDGNVLAHAPFVLVKEEAPAKKKKK